MMFSKLSILATSLMVTLAVANYPAPPTGTTNQCCSYVATSILDAIVVAIAPLIGVNPLTLLSNIGVGCTNINILSNQWYDSAHPVAVLPADDILCSSNTAVNCQTVQQGSPPLISSGCVPITF
ncbi:hypothetical protein GGX14DRAFT_397542 [Mycena pura]|uniref:Hydrophobin n=1 Tax=Mycena pura TaxID=153505 RepID=A0AAD6VA77_9AGAR|nr:hypothetical protein GGX14DRAFT_397542 [Mycena pura]